MPQPKRPPGRNLKPTQNEKATLPCWLRWLLSELHITLRQALVGTLITIFVTVVLPYLPYDSLGDGPEANKVKYYQL